MARLCDRPVGEMTAYSSLGTMSQQNPVDWGNKQRPEIGADWGDLHSEEAF